MKLLVTAAILVTACSSQRINRYVSSNFPSSFGKYQPQNPSSVNDGNYYRGQYGGNAERYADNSGQYIHDPSGDYNPELHQHEGRYIHDNSGDYFPEKYGGIGGNVGGQSAQSRFGSGVGTSGPASSLSAPGLAGVASDAAASEYVSQSGAAPVGFGTSASRYGSVSGSGSAGQDGQYDPSGSQYVVAGSAYSQSPINHGKSYYEPNYNDNARWRILRQEGEADDDSYHYLYETENQIFGEEQGKVYNKGTSQEALKANGAFQYVGPDNQVYRVDYVADENGFQPAGAHLPTPPPVPEAIERSLAYQKSIGQI